MMKVNLILLLVLCYTVFSAHVKLGIYDPITKTWSGYNPACEDQCKEAKGIQCGSGVKQCCAIDQCKTVRGFQICKKQA